MGRTIGSLTTNIYKFKCIEYENDERKVIKSTKLYSSINEMERVFGVSIRTLPKYIDNDKKRGKLNNISIMRIDPIPRFKITKKSIVYDKEEINYDTEFINSI